MTPNGAVLAAAAIVLAAITAGPYGLALLLAALLAFAAVEVGAPTLIALRRSLLVMLPLAAFMLVVWVVIVGRAPHEITAGLPGSRTAALRYVLTVATRLLLIVCLVQIVGFRFAQDTPLTFVRALYAPAAAKRIIVLTLSLVETLRHSVDRARTALIAAGILTRRWSLRNLAHGWVLVQTIWLTAITTVTARIRDKWPVEDTFALLDRALARDVRPLTPADGGWLAAALLLGAAAQLAG